jgi:hypothetical protein
VLNRFIYLCTIFLGGIQKPIGTLQCIGYRTCYCKNCRLGKSRTNPLDGDNSGIIYPLSPQINPSLALVKEESNIRGESQVTLGGK